jgi:hypothetical protein
VYVSMIACVSAHIPGLAGPAHAHLSFGSGGLGCGKVAGVMRRCFGVWVLHCVTVVCWGRVVGVDLHQEVLQCVPTFMAYLALLMYT